MATRVRAVRFTNAEDALILASATAAGLKPNAWVRRAVRETAAMEAAVAKTEAARPDPVTSGRMVPATTPSYDDFRPDFGKRLKP